MATDETIKTKIVDDMTELSDETDYIDVEVNDSNVVDSVEVDKETGEIKQ